MHFVVLFEDDPNIGRDVRQELMPQHLEFLERNAARVRAAGPLVEPDGHSAGGLWMLDAADAQEVDRLIREDPFWSTGLRKSVRVLTWRRVFADGHRL
jgi:uncharacterized protein